MATGAGSGMRPWLWLGMGAIAVVAGVVMAIQALGALGDPTDLSAAPRCDTAFAAGCVTERAAVVQERLYGGRGAWLTQEQKWLVSLTGGGPDGPRAELDLPRQSGRGELSPGLPVAVQFYGGRAAAVRLPSGRTLETTDHPRRYATFLGFLAMFSIGLGWFGARSGWETGVRAGFWRKTSSSVRSFGPMAAVGVAGMVGALLEELTGMRRLAWAGAAGVLLLCGWAWWRLRLRGGVGPVGAPARPRGAGTLWGRVPGPVWGRALVRVRDRVLVRSWGSDRVGRLTRRQRRARPAGRGTRAPRPGAGRRNRRVGAAGR